MTSPGVASITGPRTLAKGKYMVTATRVSNHYILAKTSTITLVVK